ncbi:hypothetical protein TIFTF001_004006 [Ficus carica]|uniref:Uncharacterized protein n=1 Tax=Ficus carica TaxID=3494 RepID=A0AA88CV90_FICCA|nr:hypothetical protein TIFTF001_004006 [Ficus carica]
MDSTISRPEFRPRLATFEHLHCWKKWQTMGTFKWRDLVAAAVKLVANLFVVEL